MKKIKLLCVALLLGAGVQAQNGTWYIGGEVGLGGSNDDRTGYDDKTFMWCFSPEIGTFLRDDIQLGGALNLTGESNTYDGEDQYKTLELAPVLYGRKFWSLGENFSTFAGVNLKLGFGSETTYTFDPFGDGEIKTDYLGFGGNLDIGIAYNLNDKFTVMGRYGLAGVNFDMYSPEQGDDYTVSDYGFKVNSLGPAFNIGLYYTFCDGVHGDE